MDKLTKPSIVTSNVLVRANSRPHPSFSTFCGSFLTVSGQVEIRRICIRHNSPTACILSRQIAGYSGSLHQGLSIAAAPSVWIWKDTQQPRKQTDSRLRKVVLKEGQKPARCDIEKPTDCDCQISQAPLPGGFNQAGVLDEACHSVPGSHDADRNGKLFRSFLQFCTCRGFGP